VNTTKGVYFVLICQNNFIVLYAKYYYSKINIQLNRIEKLAWSSLHENYVNTLFFAFLSTCGLH